MAVRPSAYRKRKAPAWTRATTRVAPTGWAEQSPLPRRGRRGPQRKTRKHLRAEGNRHPRFPPRGIAAAAYAKNVPLAHFLNAAAPGESAEGGYPTFLRLWFPPRGCPEQPLRPPLKMCHRHIFLTLRGPGAARVGPLPARELQNDMWQFASHTQDTCTFKGHTRLL